MIKLNAKFVRDITTKQIEVKYQHKVNAIMSKLNNKKSLGHEMTGWITYWKNNDKKELALMAKTAKKWQASGIKDVCVIGIGGSYLGIRAGVDMLSPAFGNKKFNVIWVHNIANNYLVSLLKSLKNKKFGIIVISKSGTTMEPALAFHLLKDLLIKNVGEKETNKLIVAVTDHDKGTLHDLAVKNNWIRFTIPNDIGGRYSALTPVGMYLFVLLGFDYNQIIKGAIDASKKLINPSLKSNSAFMYACFRHYFKTKLDKQIENFIVYDPSLQFIGEVYKQLFGESEGKEGKALYPSISLFTTDLHSMGQYLQEGTRNFFETTLFVKEPNENLILKIKNVEDKLLYLNNKDLFYVNKVAMESTVAAHTIEGKANNIVIELDKQDAYHFGYLFTWLSFAAMMSSYLLEVNPFNQPGVEVYKLRIKNTLRK